MPSSSDLSCCHCADFCRLFHSFTCTVLGRVKELKMQNAELEFEISLKALSVLRYITDHVER